MKDFERILDRVHSDRSEENSRVNGIFLNYVKAEPKALEELSQILACILADTCPNLSSQSKIFAQFVKPDLPIFGLEFNVRVVAIKSLEILESKSGVDYLDLTTSNRVIYQLPTEGSLGNCKKLVEALDKNMPEMIKPQLEYFDGLKQALGLGKHASRLP